MYRQSSDDAGLVRPTGPPALTDDAGRFTLTGLRVSGHYLIAAEQGAQTIVVFDCAFNMFAPRTDPTLPHALLRAAAIMVSGQVRRDLAQYGDRTILYVPGKWPPASMPYDFGSSYAKNGNESYELAMDWLEELELDGPGLYGTPPGYMRADP